jgi:UDPglucose 6-dehydrogenase
VFRENKAATEQVTATKTALEAAKGAHAIAVLTEWDEFKTLDWKTVLSGMQRPAFVFDGRNILDHDHLRELGFIVYALGKPLDPFILGN